MSKNNMNSDKISPPSSTLTTLRCIENKPNNDNITISKQGAEATDNSKERAPKQQGVNSRKKIQANRKSDKMSRDTLDELLQDPRVLSFISDLIKTKKII